VRAAAGTRAALDASTGEGYVPRGRLSSLGGREIEEDLGNTLILDKVEKQVARGSIESQLFGIPKPEHGLPRRKSGDDGRLWRRRSFRNAYAGKRGTISEIVHA
jgi:hypothetical protein